MQKFIFLTIILALTAACTPQPQPPTEIPPMPTASKEPAATPTPRQQPSQTPTPLSEVPTLTVLPNPTATAQHIPDLSTVTLYSATHLEDRRFFQVSLEGWPADYPEEIIVRVGKEIYDCDLLFPEEHPDRFYCWGPAPPKGTQTSIQAIIENIPTPLLEIPFTVPYPEDD